ncbi:uncharacterized protein M421DRAFT_421472 [Didymella exigua CBS 183.55]|uniref:Uncharacterized protein n=1 Tax=Didymella exigua CBS 183.55 TaxID=1150837 RepID=A0A6A5RH18_9PLEO|nr:uncharacterized protein M421DRAFT_421472 [Didymella exigua CBS 183.55]KAF1927631.1 hypothetical protein M421DRAFT_421472 [Didymella exigua CBS 183.55]
MGAAIAVPLTGLIVPSALSMIRQRSLRQCRGGFVLPQVEIGVTLRTSCGSLWAAQILANTDARLLPPWEGRVNCATLLLSELQDKASLTQRHRMLAVP